MRLQNEIWLPDLDTASFWSENYELKNFNKLQLNKLFAFPKISTALDIGAHVGIWSKRLAKIFNQVICYEPLPKHVECHKKNCEDFDNITLYEFALSDTHGTTLMTTKNNNSGNSAIGKKNYRNKQHVIIETRILDDFSFPMIDFMKIDVEGHEDRVLYGAERTIAKHKPLIYIEVWKGSEDKIANIMNKFGYVMTLFNPRGKDLYYLCKFENIK